MPEPLCNVANCLKDRPRRLQRRGQGKVPEQLPCHQLSSGARKALVLKAKRQALFVGLHLIGGQTQHVDCGNACQHLLASRWGKAHKERAVGGVHRNAANSRNALNNTLDATALLLTERSGKELEANAPSYFVTDGKTHGPIRLPLRQPRRSRRSPQRESPAQQQRGAP